MAGTTSEGERHDDGPPPEDPAADDRAAAARRLVPTGTGNPALDRLAELAGHLVHAASAQVSLLSDVQEVAAGAGAARASVGTRGSLVDSLCTLTMATGGPLVVTDAAADERVSSLAPVTSGQVGAYLGVPLRSAAGHLVGALCVFDSQPRRWADEDVQLLQHLAAPVVAELELAALSADYEARRLVWQLAIDAAGIGAFDWDLRTDELRWDDRLLELFGLDRATFGGDIRAFNETVHPDDLPRVTEALRWAIETCGEYAAQYRVVLPGGDIRWIGARGRALCGEDGTAVRVLGAAYDTTAAQEVEARVARVLESMPSAFYQLDHRWRFTYVNAEAERMLGRRREELLAGSLWELFPAALDSAFEENYRAAVAHGRPVAFDAYYPAPLDGWYEIRAWPNADGLAVYFVDVTERRRAQEEARRVAQRTALLAEVSSELTSTLAAAEQGVARLASLVVPRQADWCLVTLVGEDTGVNWRRRLRDVGWAHADPARRPILDRYAALRIDALTDDSFVARALHSAETLVVPQNAGRAIAAVLAPGEAKELFLQLSPTAVAVLPLRGRGRIVGLMTCFRDHGRSFDDADLETLNEVAVRAGLALDNARLYAQQRDLAEGLQRSMLTAPVTVEGVDIAVRYEPAAQAAQVGGDWYDSFLQPDDTLVVVVGDVVGHDTAAAAAMGQVRSLLRTIAVHTGAGPAEVLVGVDRVVESLGTDTTATAVVARLERDPRRDDGSVVLRWSNAGHPPPMVVLPDGTVQVLTQAEPDLLLGLDPDVSRTEGRNVLPEGATLLLYTDGLVERRGSSLDDGLAALRTRLAAAGTAAGDHGPRALVDRLLAEMVPERPDDDVAVVAVRVLSR